LICNCIYKFAGGRTRNPIHPEPDQKEETERSVAAGVCRTDNSMYFCAMILGNYHTHTRFSDGNRDPEAFAEHAMALGFRDLGFTDHAPVTFDNPWGLRWEKLGNYIRTTDRLKEQYKSTLRIYRALEIDYIPGVTFPFKLFRQGGDLDYTIGSVHLVRHPETGKLWFIDGGKEEEFAGGLREVFYGDARRGVECFYRQQIEMIRLERPDILGHLDKIKMHNKGRYFKDDTPEIRALQTALLREVKRAGTIVEVNTRGIYKGRCDELYPSERLIAECLKLQIPLMLSSDAHSPEELDGHFSATLPVLREIGVKKLVARSKNRWIEKPF
jgi:histidinol-phosphatase (PHP family)